MSRTHRTLVGLVLPAAIALVATVPWVVAWSDLPDPVATHWELAGHPDGHAPLAAALALLAGPALAGAVVLAGVAAAAAPPSAAARRRSRPNGAALVGVVAAALGGLFAVLSLGVVVANAGAASSRTPTCRSPGRWRRSPGWWPRAGRPGRALGPIASAPRRPRPSTGRGRRQQPGPPAGGAGGLGSAPVTPAGPSSRPVAWWWPRW